MTSRWWVVLDEPTTAISFRWDYFPRKFNLKVDAQKLVDEINDKKGKARIVDSARVKIRQIGGDDGYSWCVLIDGHEKWNGMQRGEAAWRRDEEVKKLT